MRGVPRILVIHAGALGDFILALSAMGALRDAFPGARIELLGRPAIAEIALGTFIDRIRDIGFSDISSLFEQDSPASGGAARFIRGFDIIVSWLADEEGIFEAALRRLCRGHVVSARSRPPAGDPRHISDYLVETLAPLGIARERPQDRILAGGFDDKKSRQEEWAPDFVPDSPLLIIHPGSGGRHKLWPAEKFSELASRAAEAGAASVAIILGPADLGLTGCFGPFRVIETGELRLVDVARILRECDLYLGNDSGITHLAAALGLPTVALFGPTDPRVWAPRGGRVTVLKEEMPCAPCDHGSGTSCGHSLCLEAIGVDEVLGSLTSTLRRGKLKEEKLGLCGTNVV